MPRAAIFYTVPAGELAQQCKKCPATIYFVPTARSVMPVRCDVEGGIAPTPKEPGRGAPHWADCPHAKQFKKVTA